VSQTGGARRIEWDNGTGPGMTGRDVWLRGTYQDGKCTLAYSLDGVHFTDSLSAFKLGYKNWKGSRPAIFNYGPGDGFIDVDYFHYTYGATIKEAMTAAGE
jgi:hypothetical protein